MIYVNITYKFILLTTKGDVTGKYFAKNNKDTISFYLVNNDKYYIL